MGVGAAGLESAVIQPTPATEQRLPLWALSGPRLDHGWDGKPTLA